jgi:hypothetical protein
MYALTQRRNRLGRGRQRLLSAALAIGIVTSFVLVPLSASATEDTGGYAVVDRTEQVSDEMTYAQSEQFKHKQEADARAERLARLQEKIAVMNGFDPDDVYTHSGDVVLPQQIQLEQALATADAYADDAVYTMYDADAVLGSAMPHATQQRVLRMIAPGALLTILYGRPGSAFM